VNLRKDHYLNYPFQSGGPVARRVLARRRAPPIAGAGGPVVRHGRSAPANRRETLFDLLRPSARAPHWAGAASSETMASGSGSGRPAPLVLSVRVLLAPRPWCGKLRLLSRLPGQGRVMSTRPGNAGGGRKDVEVARRL